MAGGWVGVGGCEASFLYKAVELGQNPRLIWLEEMNPRWHLHHWGVLNDRQGEILAPVKLMEVLLLIPVRPGFHPARGVKSTRMPSETERLIKYIWSTALLSIIDKIVPFKYKLWVSVAAKFKHGLLQALKAKFVCFLSGKNRDHGKKITHSHSYPLQTPVVFDVLLK